MACDVKSLIASANCFNCVSPGMVGLLRLAILCRIAQGITMSCDIQTLLSESSCFQCLTHGEQQLVELSLLCQIATGTGGGGSMVKQQILQDATGGPPPDPTKPALSFPTGGGGISEWDVPSQTWI